MKSGHRQTPRKKPLWFNGEKGGYSNTLWRVKGKIRQQKTSWPSNASSSVSSRLDLVLLLGSNGSGRESEVDDIAQLFLTLNKFIAQVISHPTSSIPPSSYPLKSCGDRRATKRQVWVTLGVVAADLHIGGSGHRVVLSLTGAAVESGSRLSD